MSGKKSDRKAMRFRQGVSALASLGLPIPPVYLCPLCRRGFSENDLLEKALTEEHVPPRSLGGKAMVLTCRKCNNDAGGKDGVDTHARRAEDSLDLITRSSELKLRVRFGADGRLMNARLKVTPDGYEVVGMPGPPGEAEAAMEAFLRKAPIDTTDRSITLTIKNGGFTRGRMEVSWLKSGYLAAFAAFGYRYALRKVLEPVLRQIAVPTKQLVDDFHILIPSPDSRARAIVLVSDPSWVQGILVVMGRHGVLLPLHDDDFHFYDRLAEFRDTPAQQQIQGVELVWPSPPRFELDFHPRGPLSALIARVRQGG